MASNDIDINIKGDVELNSTDVISLIKDSISQGGSFADDFRDRILNPLLHKINKAVNVDNINIKFDKFSKQLDENLFEAIGFNTKDTRDKFNSLQKRIFTSIDKLFVPNKLSFDIARDPTIPIQTSITPSFNIASIFGLTYNEIKPLKEKYKQLANNILSKIGIPDLSNQQSNLDNDPSSLTDTILEKIKAHNLSNQQSNISNDDPSSLDNSKFKSLIDEKNKTQEVVIKDIKDPALGIIKHLLDKVVINNTNNQQQDSQYKNSFLEKLALAGLGIISGSLLIGFHGMFSDGPLKGLEKIMMKMGLNVGGRILSFITSKALKIFELITGPVTKVFGEFADDFLKLGTGIISNVIKPLGKTALGKMMGKGIAWASKALKAIKIIPFLGSLISFGYAYDRIVNQNQIFQGILDIASGVANLFPLVGTGISIGLDVVNAMMDLTPGTDAPTKLLNIGNKWMDIAGNFIYDMLEDSLKYVPGFDMLYALGAGAGMIVAGDISGGIKEMVLYGIPGVGGIIRGLVDLFDTQLTNGPQRDTIGTRVYDFFGKIKDWVTEKFKKTSLYNFVMGIQSLFTGDISTGLKYLDETSYLPGVGLIAALLDANDEAKADPTGNTKVNFGKIIKDYMKKKVIKLYNDAPSWMQFVMNRIPGMDDIIDIPEDSWDVKDSNAKKTIKDYSQKIALEQQFIKDSEQNDFVGRRDANKKIQELQATIDSLTKGEDTADDFISRPGQKAQKFSKDDMVIGIKKDQPLYELLSLLDSDNKLSITNDIKDKISDPIEKLISTLNDKKEPIININQDPVVRQLDKMTSVLIAVLESLKNIGSNDSGMANIPINSSVDSNIRSPAGLSKDPIYNFRSRYYTGGYA